MPLIMGILAQGVAAPPAAVDAYDLLETEILTGTQASVTFSSLNSTYGSTYQHLQIRMTARTDRAAALDYPIIYVNGVTSASYSRHELRGNGSSVTSGGGANSSTPYLPYAPGNTAGASQFAASVIDILDPFSATKNTTIRALGGWTGTNNYILLTSAAYLSTDAVTSLTLDLETATSYVTGSRFSLYGLKGA